MRLSSLRLRLHSASTGGPYLTLLSRSLGSLGWHYDNHEYFNKSMMPEAWSCLRVFVEDMGYIFILTQIKWQMFYSLQITKPLSFLPSYFLWRASTAHALGRGRGRNWCWRNCERRQWSAVNLDNIVFKLLKSFPHQGINNEWKRDVFCPCAFSLMLRDWFLWHNLVRLKLWALDLGFRKPMRAQDVVLPADRFIN